MKVFVLTSEDWSKSYRIAGPDTDLMLLKMEMVKIFPDRHYRVHIWGTDDFGMEYDTDNQFAAETMFAHITTIGDVTCEKLEKLTFKYA